MAALFDRTNLLGEISLHLSIMEVCLKWHTQRGHNDQAKSAEDATARFLAALCGWKLINLNSIRPNYPAADLGDLKQGIAIQVTVDGTSQKIRKTHEKAVAHKLGQDFHTLIILFLLEKAPSDPKEEGSFTRCTRPIIEIWARPQLNEHLNKLETADLRIVLEVLRDEMSAIRQILSPALAYRPCNLPFASIGSQLKGRDSFLDSLHITLTSSSSVAIKSHAIRGDGGIGKTCVAVEYAWRNFFSYTALLFVRSDDPVKLETDLAALGGLEVLNLPGHSEKKHPEQLAAVLHYLQTNNNWLMILDNVDTAEAMIAVKERLPSLNFGRVIITTRRNVAIKQITALDLDFLSEDESIALLEESTSGSRSHAADDKDAVRELARLLDGLPLALAQAAAHINHVRLSYRGYLQLWADNTDLALNWYNAEVMDYPRSLAVTYQTSVAQLTAPALDLFHVFAWFAADPIPFSILDGLEDASSIRESISELENLSLARQSKEEGGCFTIHRLVQEITRQQQVHTLAPQTLKEALQWLNYCFIPDSASVENWIKLTPLAAHGHTSSTYGIKCGFYEESSTLISKVGLLNRAKANYAIAEAQLRLSLDIHIMYLDPEAPVVVSHLNNLGVLFMDTDRFDEAEQLYKRALSILEVHPDKDDGSLPLITRHLGILLFKMQRLKESELIYQRTLPLFKKTYGERHRYVGVLLNDYGELLLKLNKLRESEMMITEGISILESGELSHEEHAGGLNNLGQVYEATGRIGEAESLYRKALEITEKYFLQDHPILAVQLNNLSGALMKLGRPIEAEELARRALMIDQTFYGDDHAEVATDLLNLGGILAKSKRMKEAEPLIHRSLAIWRDLFGENHDRVAECLNTLGFVSHLLGRLVEAEDFFTRASKIFEFALGPCHSRVANSLVNLSQVLGDSRRYNRAREAAFKALGIFVESSLVNGQLVEGFDDCVHACEHWMKMMKIKDGEISARINAVIYRVAKV